MIDRVHFRRDENQIWMLLLSEIQADEPMLVPTDVYVAPVQRRMGVGVPAFNALAVSKEDKTDFTSESF